MPARKHYTCTIRGCSNEHHARGWCLFHYEAWRRTGSPLSEVKPYLGRLPLKKRLKAQIEKDSSGCWLWTGSLNPQGYGQVHVKGKNRGAHRVVYEVFRGPIPDGMTLDHLCRVRHCVRPSHLEPVTAKENLLRGIGPSAIHAQKTHCVNGHEFTLENTYVTSCGSRMCRTCHRIRQARYASERRQNK